MLSKQGESAHRRRLHRGCRGQGHETRRQDRCYGGAQEIPEGDTVGEGRLRGSLEGAEGCAKARACCVGEDDSDAEGGGCAKGTVAGEAQGAAEGGIEPDKPDEHEHRRAGS
jgi:hypothetical protein